MSPTLHLLRSLIEINSVFPNEAALSRYMQGLLREKGFHVDELISEGGRPSIVATYGKASQYLAFYGHLDTVPPDPAFTFNPFDMKTDDINAYGLGVADMKGGNACILSAAFDAAEKGLPVKVVFGVDEEDISLGAHDLVTSGLLKDVAFMVVAESGQILDFSQQYSVGLGRKGRILFEARVHGTTSHAAVATPEGNAISRAAVFVKLLEELDFPSHHGLGKSRVIPHTINASTDSFSAPGECTLRFSVLTTPGVTSDGVSAQIKEKAATLGLKVEFAPVNRKTPYGEAYEAPRGDRFVQLLEEQVFGPAKVKPEYFSSVADENVFAHRLKIPVITLGPIGADEHSKDEWVRVSSLDATVEAYKKIIRLWSAR
jgi:succinyl-diaminopimelate desuccinylase